MFIFRFKVFLSYNELEIKGKIILNRNYGNKVVIVELMLFMAWNYGIKVVFVELILFMVWVLEVLKFLEMYFFMGSCYDCIKFMNFFV